MAMSALRNALARTVAPAQRATLASASTVSQRCYHENVSFVALPFVQCLQHTIDTCLQLCSWAWHGQPRPSAHCNFAMLGIQSAAMLGCVLHIAVAALERACKHTLVNLSLYSVRRQPCCSLGSLLCHQPLPSARGWGRPRHSSS